MPELKSFPETLEYHFESTRGIVQIYFSISVEFTKSDRRTVSFYDILTNNHISLSSQYNTYDPKIDFINFYYDIFPATREFVRISINRKEFLMKFKKYYLKYLKKHTDIIEKYTKKFDPIAVKHLKTISSSIKISNIIENWIRGGLSYVVNRKGEIRKFKEDADNFFEKLDLFQEDKFQNPKVLLKEMNKVFDEFPKYSKEFTVWRGFNVNKDFQKGDIIKNPIPFSTSLLPYTARGFLGNVCCLLEINVPKKFPAIFLHKFRFWEKEVILPRCNFEVLETKEIKRGDLTKYLGDPDIPWIQQYKRPETFLTEYIVIAKCKVKENDF